MKKTLAALLCVGFLYRILSLGARQLWTDELMQALVVQSSSVHELLVNLRDGVSLPAPLDFFIQKCFVLILGESNWALRFHAVVLATLSLWFFFRIGRQLFGGRIALYSTGLLAFYPLHYHYSQEGGPFALSVLLTLVSFNLLLRQLADPKKGWKGWAALALAQVLLLYSSLLGFMVMLAQSSCLIASAFLNVKQKPAPVSGGDGTESSDLPPANSKFIIAYVLTAAVACLSFVPWLRFVWGHVTIPHVSMILSYRLPLSLLSGIGDNSLFVAAFLIAGVIAGIRALLRHRRPQSLLWLLGWSGILVSGILSLDICLPGWYATHYLVLVAPPLVLIAGYGLSHVGERMAFLDRLPYQMSSPALAYGAILLVASGWIAHSHWKKEPVDWRGAAKFLQQAVRPGDAVAMPKTYPLLEYYAPSLEEFRTNDLAAGPGSVGEGEVRRRLVVCLDEIHPDPCASFRRVADKDRAWRRIDSVRGFTVFMRAK